MPDQFFARHHDHAVLTGLLEVGEVDLTWLDQDSCHRRGSAGDLKDGGKTTGQNSLVPLASSTDAAIGSIWSSAANTNPMR
jgi:hypothetical protein